MINNNIDGPLVLIIAPTREIAWQASEVVESIGNVETGNKAGHVDVPLNDIVLESAEFINN